MDTPRQPVSRVSKALIAFALLVVPIAIFLVARSYFLAVATLLVLGAGYTVYFLGMSSGLPGTSGKGGRDVRT